MDAPGGRDKGKDLDPKVAGELERRPAREGSASEQAGYGPGQAPAQTREGAARAGQPNPRTSREEGSAASYKERAEPRDDAVEDGG
jgi:hypothetical protein